MFYFDLCVSRKKYTSLGGCFAKWTMVVNTLGRCVTDVDLQLFLLRLLVTAQTTKVHLSIRVSNIPKNSCGFLFQFPLSTDGVGGDFHPPQDLVADTFDIDRVRSSSPPTLSIVELLSINQVRKQTNR